MKKLLPLLILITFLATAATIKANSASGDQLFFSQVVNKQKTLYYANDDGLTVKVVASGKNITPFFVGKHFLYYTDHQLFEYNLGSGQSKLLNKFTEDHIYIQGLPGESEKLDQALILEEDYSEQTYYILDFSDDSVRKVRNKFTYSDPHSIKGYSFDEKKIALVQQAGSLNDYRFQVIVQEKTVKGFRTEWVSPNHITVMPGQPLWSPNSGMIAFYAKEHDNLEGFYSLYLFDLETKELKLVQEQVFAKFAFGDFQVGPFVPSWSSDSKYLLFEYQPYGLPTQSSIMTYDVASTKKIVLTESHSKNDYPTWSPSGKIILFFSNRESPQDQLYIMSDTGTHIKRVSPADGLTDWAQWYNPD